MIAILGADGYVGFPLCMHLVNKGLDVVGVDRFLRRQWVAEVGSHSAVPIVSMKERLKSMERHIGRNMCFEYGDLTDYDFVHYVLDKYKPDTVVHLAQQASAPFSMIDVKHAVLTQTNNLVGTLNVLYAIHNIIPHCHLVKLGSMGEYGTPNIDIPEGLLDIEYNGRRDTLPFPKHAFTDWYHWSKVYDSDNIIMACEIWGLRATDIMQGIVYGTRTAEMHDESLNTRFDFDAVFGTALNRFCAQSIINYNLTPYGSGGQKRPFIALADSIQCFLLAIENPAEKGECRVFNQFDEVYSTIELARQVKTAADALGFNTEIEHYPNPRVEDEHVQYYNPLHEKLYQLGFHPTHTLQQELEVMLKDLSKYRDRIMAKKDKVSPNIQWRT